MAHVNASRSHVCGELMTKKFLGAGHIIGPDSGRWDYPTRKTVVPLFHASIYSQVLLFRYLPPALHLFRINLHSWLKADCFCSVDQTTSTLSSGNYTALYRKYPVSHTPKLERRSMSFSSTKDQSSAARGTMQPHSTTASQPASGDLGHVSKSETFARGLFASIRGFFVGGPPVKEAEDDAVGGWVGVRKGRGRCRSVGEVH